MKKPVENNQITILPPISLIKNYHFTGRNNTGLKYYGFNLFLAAINKFI